MKKKYLQKGFTLIELLVVIAIIGLLSSVVLSSLNTARSKARDAKRIGDLRQIQLALDLYYQDNGRYPALCGAASASGNAYSYTARWTSNLTTALSPYMPSLPNDPLNIAGSNAYYYCHGYRVDVSNGTCTRSNNGRDTEFLLATVLENPYNSQNYCSVQVFSLMDNVRLNYFIYENGI